MAIPGFCEVATLGYKIEKLERATQKNYTFQIFSDLQMDLFYQKIKALFQVTAEYITLPDNDY